MFFLNLTSTSIMAYEVMLPKIQEKNSRDKVNNICLFCLFFK